MSDMSDITSGDMEIGIDGTIHDVPAMLLYYGDRLDYRFDQSIKHFPTTMVLGDHLFGFNEKLQNTVFDKLNSYAVENNFKFTIFGDQFFSKEILNQYPNLDI